MSGSGGDEADYVLIYDGANGLRMAPRAAAAAFEGQDPAHLDMSIPPPATAPDASAPRPRPTVVVIGAVIGLSLLGLLAGLFLRLPSAPPAERIELPAPAAPALAGAPARNVPAPTHAPPVRRARPLHAAAAGASKPRVHRIAARRVAPAGPCATVTGRAARMVCLDPELAAQDARLAQALKAAAEAGVSSQELQDGQTAWQAQRDTASRRSRDEVSDVYRRRIEDLESQVTEAPPF